VGLGNIGALPKHIQQRIDNTTRSNARAYYQGGGFVFSHSILSGLRRPESDGWEAAIGSLQVFRIQLAAREPCRV
jgi:hypothetical protein